MSTSFGLVAKWKYAVELCKCWLKDILPCFVGTVIGGAEILVTKLIYVFNELLVVSTFGDGDRRLLHLYNKI